MSLKAQDQAAPSVWLLISAPFWVQLNMVVNGKRGKKAKWQKRQEGEGLRGQGSL